MHEGDHNILDDDHEHKQKHRDGQKHLHAHPHEPRRRADPTRVIAGAIVVAAIVVFVVWRFI
ncbi:MAG: hypothetical protein QME77_07520 [bacterium]|nr:hypothetical protein [bacterium]